MAFCLYVSLQNLVTASALWARMADTFDASAAPRLFGLLGAGATCGERRARISLTTRSLTASRDVSPLHFETQGVYDHPPWSGAPLRFSHRCRAWPNQGQT